MLMSFVFTALLTLLEFVVAIILKSNLVTVGAVVSLADFLLMIPSMALIPLLYKPVTEKRPYGYSQAESLIVVIRYSILLFVDLGLIYNSILTIIRGGTTISVTSIVLYKIAMVLICFLIYHRLFMFSMEYTSEIIEVEICLWKTSIFNSLAVAIAMVMVLFLKFTPLSGLVKYADPIAAVIMGIVVMRDPFRELITNFRNLLLFAPKAEVVEQIRMFSDEELGKYSYKTDFIDVIRTGRKYWINIYFSTRNDVIEKDRLKNIHDSLAERMQDQFDEFYIELIPSI